MASKQCLICNGEKIVFFTKTSDRHYGHDNLFFNVSRCGDCGVTFLDPMIGDDELFTLYPEDYYRPNVMQQIPSRFVSALKRVNSLLTGFYANDIKIFDFKGKTVLDIGIGDGDFLRRIKAKGANVNGVEIRKDACDRGNELGLNVRNGTLLQAAYPSEYFDYIRSNHSFEHLTNPIETLQEIHRILKSGGTFFVGIPNNRGLMALIFKKYWYYLGVPFHPYNYNVKALTLLLAREGFRVTRTIYNGNYNGILGSIQILLNSGSGLKSNEGAFSNFLTRIIFHQLARVLNGLKVGD